MSTVPVVLGGTPEVDGRAAAASDFDELFRAHRGRVLSLCLRLCGSRALAEDALQETFLEVFG